MEQQQSALFSAIAYSYIHFIDDYLAVLSNPARHSIPYIDDEVGNILGEIQTLFLSMPSLLNGDAEFKEIYAKKLVDFRETLEEKYRNLHALQRELQHTTSFFTLKTALTTSNYEDFGMTEEDALSMDFSRLAKDCTSFVFKESDPLLRQQKASSLLTHVPMRMTKDSFMSYVEKALFSIAIEDTPESATLLTGILAQQFDGRLYTNYVDGFADLRQSIEELLLLESSEDFFEDAELLNETLDYAVQLTAKLYHMICTFSNLLIFDAMSFETLTDMHVSFYDLYCSLQNILSNHADSDILLETLPERVDDIKDQLQTAFTKVSAKTSDDSLFALMGTYLHMSIHHVFGFTTAKHEPYSEETTSILRGFLTDMRHTLESLNPAERKLRMQYFMSVMPLMMRDNTFYDYLMHGFTNTKHPITNLYTAMYLSNLLEQGGFFEESDDAQAALGVDSHDFHEDDDAAHFLKAHPHHDTCSCGHHHADPHHECCGGHHDDPVHECCGGHHDDPNHTCNCGHDHA
ncbi:MAG: hypothetical protein ACRCWY_07595 [Cellulosilyticaceae bacterium]